MTTDNRELLRRILAAKQDCTEKIELGTLMLELYEHVEEELIRKWGIHIRLNLYEGVDSCVYGNRIGIRMCLEAVLYSLIERHPETAVIEFSIQNKEDRTWAIFRKVMEQSQNHHPEIHTEETEQIVKEYFDSQDIMLKIEDESKYEAKIGFCNMDGR